LEHIVQYKIQFVYFINDQQDWFIPDPNKKAEKNFH